MPGVESQEAANSSQPVASPMLTKALENTELPDIAQDDTSDQVGGKEACPEEILSLNASCEEIGNAEGKDIYQDHHCDHCTGRSVLRKSRTGCRAQRLQNFQIQ